MPLPEETISEEHLHQEAVRYLEEGERHFQNKDYVKARIAAEQAVQRMKGIEDSVKARIRKLWSTSMQLDTTPVMHIPERDAAPFAPRLPAAQRIPDPEPVFRKPAALPAEPVVDTEDDFPMHRDPLADYLTVRFGALPKNEKLQDKLQQIDGGKKEEKIDAVRWMLRSLDKGKLPDDFVRGAFMYIRIHRIVRLKHMLKEPEIRKLAEKHDLVSGYDSDEGEEDEN